MVQPTTSGQLTTLLASLKTLRASWPKPGWSWDTRFTCVSSAFGVDLDDAARKAASPVLSAEWTPRTLVTAPPAVREIAEATGGLRQGQLLWTSAPIVGVFAYGLWWPWGDGMMTSLRIGLAGMETRKRDDVLTKLRDTFAVSL